MILSLTWFFSTSIEFDRDCDYFAIAGVTKKIKVFPNFVYLIQITFSLSFICSEWEIFINVFILFVIKFMADSDEIIYIS